MEDETTVRLQLGTKKKSHPSLVCRSNSKLKSWQGDLTFNKLFELVWKLESNPSVFVHKNNISLSKGLALSIASNLLNSKEFAIEMEKMWFGSFHFSHTVILPCLV